MIGSSFCSRSLLPAPAPDSAEATWLLSLPPKIVEMTCWPSAWSAPAALPSRPWAAKVLAALVMLSASPGSWALWFSPLTSTGTRVRTVLSTSPESAPSWLAMSWMGICAMRSSRPAMRVFVHLRCWGMLPVQRSKPTLAETPRPAPPIGTRSAQPGDVHRDTGRAQPGQQRVTHRHGRGEHPVVIGQRVAVQRQRQGALGQQHRGGLIARVAPLGHHHQVAGPGAGGGVGLGAVVAVLAGAPAGTGARLG